MIDERNVFGEPLQLCSDSPLTGFFRSGYCQTGPDGSARHTVCIRATAEFLTFSKERGNDLSTPKPEWGFPGLKPGDRWCLLALRWVEAYRGGMAPKIYLQATHEHLLEHVGLEALMAFALDVN